MKRLIMILAFVCSIGTLGLFAQGSSFYIGARTGLNSSKFKFTEDLKELYPTVNGQFGINGGFDMGLQLQEWSIQTGLHYVQKGSEYQTDNFTEFGQTGFFTGNEKLHYISIPLLLGYHQQVAPGFGWTVAVGPSFNFGLGGKVDETVEYFGDRPTDYQNYKVEFGSGLNEDYKATQIGFQVAPGLYFDLNDRSTLNFNVTWDFGTSDIFNPRYKDANDFFADNKGNQVNRTVMFNIGYQYHFNFADRY